MRSATPKVLHELCGRPMGLWPVRRGAGGRAPGKVVVVDSPARPLAELLPDGVELVVQEQPDGTGGAVGGRRSRDRSRRSAGGRAERRRAARQRRRDRASSWRPTRQPARPRRCSPRCSTTRPATAASCATATAPSSASSRRRPRRRHGDRSSRSARSTPGIYAFDGAALPAALPRLATDNAQGELYLPQVLELLRADGARSPRTSSHDPRLVLGVNDRVGARARCAQLAQREILERHMLRRRDDRRPATTSVDVDVDDRPGRTDRAAHVAARARPASATRRHRRARTAR